jgi:hypothetical protein
MRRRGWLACLLLLLAACDSNDEEGLRECRFEMELSGALEGRVSGRSFFTVSEIGPSPEYLLELRLEPDPEVREVAFGVADTTCRIATGGAYPGIRAHLGAYPEAGRYRTGDPSVLDFGVTALLDAYGCGAQILSPTAGVLTLDRVAEARMEGTFATPLTVTYGPEVLEASLTSRFNARLYDDTIADCFGN